MKTMTQTKPIRGKVARVLNNREIAINRGSNDGVELGMKFNILAPETYEIRDPDTGELLGHIDRPKAPVKVTMVYDKIAVATTFRSRTVNVGGNGIGMGVFVPPKWRKRYETFRENGAKAKTKSKGGAEFSAQVSIGDPVVQIIEAESDKDSARKSARINAIP